MISRINLNLTFHLIDEPGVIVGKITPNIPSRAFLGYVDQKASESKIVRDIFSKGDSGFLSGTFTISCDQDNFDYLFFIKFYSKSILVRKILNI